VRRLGLLVLEERLRVLVWLVVGVAGTNVVVQVFFAVILGQLTVRNVHHAAAEVRIVRLGGDDQPPHVHEGVFATFLKYYYVEWLLEGSSLL